MLGTLVITGGIGSGKSLVCSMFSELGVPVYDSDTRAKALYYTDPGLVGKLETVLRMPLRTADGIFDKDALAKAVFSSSFMLDRLESVVHPAVLEDFICWKSNLAASPSCGFVIFESAIILEKPLFRSLGDWTLLVDAPVELRMARAMERDGVSREEVLARMKRQPLMNDISERAVSPAVDFIIENDRGEEELRAQVSELYERLASINEQKI